MAFTPQAFSAPGGASTFQTLTFANSNGVSFTNSNGSLVASVATNYLTTAALSNHSHGFSADGGSSAFQTITFANSNGVSFSNSNGSLIATVKTDYLTSQSNQAVSAANGSYAFQTLSFSNANGISFGTSAGSAITASHNALTTARASTDAIGLNTAQSNVTWTVNSSGLSLDARGYAGTGTSKTGGAAITLNSNGLAFDGSGLAGTNTTFNGANISGSMTVNTQGVNLSLSVAPGGGGADGYNILAAGTQTAATTGTVLFNNANGITFGMANSSVITASHNALTSQSNQAFSADASSTFQTLVFQDSNGVSFSNNAGSLRITHALQYTSNTSNITSNALHTSSPRINVSAGTTSNNLSAITFANGNGISFGLNASTLTASHNGLTTARASNDAIGLNTAQTNVTWTVNSSGLSLNAAGYAGTGTSKTGGAVITLNSNGLAFNGAALAGTNTTFNGTNVSGSMTINTDGVRLDLSAGAGGGGVTPVASASNGSFSFTTLGFSNANNVTFGTSAGSIITASVAAPGAAAENNNINLLGANTAGNTTASGSTIGYSGINLTLSGTNGSVVNISAPAVSNLVGVNGINISTDGSTISISGQPYTFSYYNPQDAYLQVVGQQGQGTLHIQPMQAPNVQFDRVAMPIHNTNSSNSSGSHTLSFWLGLFTRNSDTLSLYGSTSSSTAVTHSGTAGSYSLYSGIRLFTIGSTTTLPEGQYWMGILSRTTSGGNNGTYSQLLASQGASSFFGHFGSAVNATMQYTRGLGTYSVTTSGMPSSIAFSDIRGASNSLVLRQPIFYFVSGTV